MLSAEGLGKEELLYGAAIAAVILIALLVWLIVLIVKNSNRKILLVQQASQLDALSSQLKQLSEVNTGYVSENTRLKTEAADLRRHMEEKLQYIEQNKNDMALKFRDISNEILRQQTAQINETQKNSLSSVLTPFREQLMSFRDEVNKANTENIKNKTLFDKQFQDLMHLNQTLSADAQNLTEALRGSKKMQGDWGEVELNRILDISGLQKNIDYFTQENFKNENNQNLRPDVVVKLPNKRSVIVDSKVSMNDYVSYVNSDNEDDKKLYLQKHIQCIKAHIDELSAKEYQKLLKEESLDYVIIFIPIESAFAAAIKEDATLYDYAYKKNIALTTPSSLLPLLRTIENLWQIENRNKYVQKIAEVGGSLYDKLANFVDDMQKIEKNLTSANQSYTQAISKLSQGKGNALSLAARLKDYGAKANKVINHDFDDSEHEQLMLNDNSDEKVS
ncbi:MAG: DNA recombination protein RmuC [Alphaproteobacteria bacterium]|nr:DNA recombination protein RmuC [Alphaproteobacteria bacterium]